MSHASHLPGEIAARDDALAHAVRRHLDRIDAAGPVAGGSPEASVFANFSAPTG